MKVNIHIIIFIIFNLPFFISSNACVLEMSQYTDLNDSIQNDTTSLDEVIVLATKQLTKFDIEGYVTKIKGSILEKLGTANDVLSYVPGVSNNNGIIEIIGKGVPVIYINGKLVTDNLQLNDLKSNQINEIKVVTNPGVRFAPGTAAVIQIKTLKEYGEGFSLDSRTTATYSDFIKGAEQIYLNFRTNKWDFFSSLYYENSKIKESNKYLQNSPLLNNNKFETANQTVKNLHNFYGTVGFNYTSSDEDSYGFYYQRNNTLAYSDINSTSSQWESDLMTNKEYLRTKENENYYQNLFSAYYDGKWGNFNSQISLNYLWRGTLDNRVIENFPIVIENNIINSHNQNKGNLLAGEINLKKPFFNGLLSFGASYSRSIRSESFTSLINNIPDNDNSIREWTVSCYIEFSQKIKDVTLMAGIRYTNNNGKFFDFLENSKNIKRRYNELLPTLSLMIPLRNTTFLLSYSRLYQRPLYSQLSNAIIYVNNNLYETGNPILKSSSIDFLSLNFKYRWLTLLTNYRIVKDRVITISEPYESSDITILYKINSKHKIHAFDITASITPGVLKNFYYPILTTSVLYQSYNINFLENIKQMNTPIGIINFNSLFILPSNFMLMATFSWRSKGDSDNIQTSGFWKFDLAVSKKFNKHWEIKLSLNDIFNTTKQESINIYSPQMNTYIQNRICKSSIELIVGYHFNMPTSRYKGNLSGQSEMDRF